jgi:argininosuccinate synthase
MKPKKIVLAFSGGLDTSAALHYLKKQFGCKVYAFCADVGQRDDWEDLKQRAYTAGAEEFYVADLKEHFINDFVFQALKANASYENHYLLGTPLARPVIVEGMVQYAHKIGADTLSHGCTPKGNDQIRFELSTILLDRNLSIIAPWRVWPFESREDLVEYCEKNKVPIIHSKDDILSHDENLVHFTTEGDYLEHLENAFLWKHACWITPPEDAPDAVEYVTISFKDGVPHAINEKENSPVSIITQLNEIGARNGVGMQDIIENRINGIKVRGIFENPALVILHKAHRQLECATMSGEVQKIRDMLIYEYGEILYKGLWFSEERKVIQALVDRSQRHVTGDVVISLYKGSAVASSIKSDYTLYSRDLVTLHKGLKFESSDAEGFIKTLSMRLHMEAERDEKK